MYAGEGHGGQVSLHQIASCLYGNVAISYQSLTLQPQLQCLVARVALVVCTDAILIAIYSGRASLGTQLSPLLYLVASKSVPILRQLGDTATWDAAVCCNAIALSLAGCSLLVLSVSPRCRSALDLLALTINAGPLIKVQDSLSIDLFHKGNHACMYGNNGIEMY